MIKTNLKIAWRHLQKNKTFSLINIFGLSIGMAAFMMIYFYVSFEKSYDKNHQDADRLYRIVTDNFINGEVTARDAGSFAPTGQMLQEQYPEVEAFSTSFPFQGELFVEANDQLYVEEKVIFADSNFMKFFSHNVIQGNLTNALSEPNTIILTQSLAKKYFGEEDPHGKTIMVYNGFDAPFKVTGVIPDPPVNTHYRFDALGSLPSVKNWMDWHGWKYYSYYTYLKLHEGADVSKFVEQIRDLPKKYVNENTTLVFDLQAVPDIHLKSGLDYEIESNGNAKIVSFLSIIGFFILFIAWVNYINLSTAKSLERVKEIAMKRVIGAERKQLFGQFLTEAFIINLIGILAAVTLCQLAMPLLNDVLPVDNAMGYWFRSDRIILIAVLFFASTFFSGFYPAVVLSSGRAISFLRKGAVQKSIGFNLRRALVIFQFGTSLALVVGTVVVYQQIDYMRNRQLGVTLEQVVSFKSPRNGFEGNEERVEKIETFKNTLVARADVVNVGRSSSVPDGGETVIFTWAGGVILDGEDKEDRSTYSVNWVDSDFMQTMGIQLVAGRFFDIQLQSDTASIILNETARKKLGFAAPELALGHYIQRGKGNERFRVVGVIADYNRLKLKHTVAPTFYNFVPRGGFRYIVTKLQPGDIKTSMTQIAGIWKSLFPLSPMRYQFLDEQFGKAYEDDEQFAGVFTLFAALAIFIACLGLFGLSSFLVVQKTKEIGVRKVLGASISNVLHLLYKNFLYLILISIVIGTPTIHFIMNEWLDGYSYRIDVPWWAYILASVILISISFLTVGIQTLKTAASNPAKSLRYE